MGEWDFNEGAHPASSLPRKGERNEKGEVPHAQALASAFSALVFAMAANLQCQL